MTKTCPVEVVDFVRWASLSILFHNKRRFLPASFFAGGKFLPESKDKEDCKTLTMSSH